MPQPVERVTLNALGDGRVEVQWSPAPHAKRYRVQMRLAGAEVFDPVINVHDTETVIQHLVAGTTIEVRVIAANKLDEAAPSLVASVVVS